MFIETCLVHKFFLTNPTGEAFNLAQVIFTQRNWWHRRLFASVSCCWLLNVSSHFKAMIMLLLFSRTLYRVFFFLSLATWKLAKAPFRMFAWILLQSCCCCCCCEFVHDACNFLNGESTFDNTCTYTVRLYPPSVWVCSCTLQFDKCLEHFLQFLHEYGFSPVWIRSCCL